MKACQVDSTDNFVDYITAPSRFVQVITSQTANPSTAKFVEAITAPSHSAMFTKAELAEIEREHERKQLQEAEQRQRRETRLLREKREVAPLRLFLTFLDEDEQ